MNLWRNPEFVRYARAELRPTRAITVAAVTLVLLLLFAISDYGSQQKTDKDFWKTLFIATFSVQVLLLALWNLLAASQSIASERTLKTYDFVRTTRLSGFELLVGRTFGVAILSWFAVLCSLPIALAAGMLGGIRLDKLLFAYLIAASLAVLLAVAGLAMSVQMEKSSAGASVVLFFFLYWTTLWTMIASVSFPGVSALSPIPAFAELFDLRAGSTVIVPQIFGVPIAHLVCTLLLYWSLTAWFAAIVVRNIKRELEDVQPFSRTLAVGFSVYVNFLMFAFFVPMDRDALNRVGYGYGVGISKATDFTALVVGVNLFLLYMVGLTTIVNRERLKVWSRRAQGVASWFHPDAPQWPWQSMAAAAFYLFLWAYALPARTEPDMQHWPLGMAALNLGTALVFAVRDTLFIQYCHLTRVKNATTKGVLWLALYYCAVAIMIGSLAGATTSWPLVNLLTPGRIFDPWKTDWLGSAWLGLLVQGTVCGVLLYFIHERLRKQNEMLRRAEAAVSAS